MFYGAKLQPGRSVVPRPEDGGEILHISQVCLVDPSDSSPTYLQVESEGQNYCVCALQKGKEESATMDLFVSTQQSLRLSTKGGKNEVHVVGYFEPDGMDAGDDDDDDEEEVLQAGSNSRRKVAGLGSLGDDDEDDDDSLLDDEDDDDELEDEDGTPKIEEITGEKEAMKSVLKRLPPSGGRGKGSALKDENDDENDDEDDDEDEDDEDELDDDDDDDDELKEEEITGKAAATKNGTGKRPMTQQQQQQKSSQQQPNKKQKTGNAQQGGKGSGAAAANGASAPAKKGGAPAGATPGGGAADKEAFRQQLISYLKKNGRTALGVLGQKVKKPPSVADKLGKILKDNPQTFKVENGFVSV